MKPSLRPGQRVTVDLFGLGHPGSAGGAGGLEAATIVALGPGTLTVQVGNGADRREVTVGQARLRLSGAIR